MNLKSQQKSISKALPISNVKLLEVLLLAALGGLAIILRAKLRIPLNMPGHHGIEIMALIIAGRSLSNIKFGSSISTLMASIFILIPIMGFKDPFLPVIYILMGLSIDFIYSSFAKWKNNVVFLSLLGGIAYMMIPLSRILITLTTGFPYSSLIKHGFVASLSLHFAFGVLGALIGAGICLPFIKKKQ